MGVDHFEGGEDELGHEDVEEEVVHQDVQVGAAVEVVVEEQPFHERGQHEACVVQSVGEPPPRYGSVFQRKWLE